MGDVVEEPVLDEQALHVDVIVEEFVEFPRHKLAARMQQSISSCSR